jgi:flagellar biosynthesis/type III secretory pathway protein FliH
MIDAARVHKSGGGVGASAVRQQALSTHAASLQDAAQQKGFPSKAARERARAAEAATAEAAQREREEALNREQWDAYENNLLSNIAEGMQEGSVMARIGSLTVRRLVRMQYMHACMYACKHVCVRV